MGVVNPASNMSLHLKIDVRISPQSYFGPDVSELKQGVRSGGNAPILKQDLDTTLEQNQIGFGELYEYGARTWPRVVVKFEGTAFPFLKSSNSNSPRHFKINKEL